MAKDDFFHKVANNLEIFYFPELRHAFPAHFHDAHLLGCLLKGVRSAEVGGKNIILNSGDCLLIPAGIPHTCSEFGSGASKWICFHIREDHPCLYPRTFKNEFVYGLFRRLAAKIASGAAGSEVPVEECFRLWQYIHHLPPSLRLKEDRTSPAGPGKPRLNEGTSLDELAKAQGLNKYHYLRAFKASYGITPYSYLEALRISMGQTLLRAGAPLAGCALESGFCDQSHFTHSFKSRIGITPGAYRRAWQIASH